MNQPLKPVKIISNVAADAGVLEDLLRCYGYYILKEAQGIENLKSLENISSRGVCVPLSPRHPLTLLIAWDRQQKSVRLCWSNESFTCCQEEEVRPFAFEETRENRRRRVLRLALHHLIVKNNITRPNPWGILTGVRPTKMIHRFLDQGLSESEIQKILDIEYGVEPERIELLLSTVLYQRPYLLSKEEALKKIGIYLSFPFCPSRCSYCSFPGYDINRWHKRVQPCIDAMVKEIQVLGAATQDLGLKVQTFYFGGGTPTSMSPKDMDIVLTALQSSFSFTESQEWTIEGGRPETLTEDMLRVLSKYPISRLCINPQTMQQQTLDHIHRNHSVGLIEEAFNRVRQTKNLNNCIINSDLILGLPGENIPELTETLDRLLSLAPENITTHCLAIKRGSEYKTNLPNMLTGDQAVALGNLARTKLLEAGYVPYYLYRQKDILGRGENVGYTLPNKHSLYNIHMMEERQIILGLGVGSCSKFISRDDWSLENMYNPKDLIQYVTRITELIKRKVDKLIEIV